MTEPANAPLLDLLQELRRRNFPLGVDEYVVALRALAAGFGDGSREGLLLLCSSLWTQSIEEVEQVADVLDGLLPPRVTEQALQRSGAPAAEPEESARDDWAPDRDEPLLRRESPQEGVDSPSPAQSTAAEPPAKDSGAVRPWIGRETVATPGGSTFADLRPEPRTWQLNPRFDFVGSLPVTHRRISQTWRQYRRMSRVGQQVDFDVKATVEQLHREGTLVEPVLVPRRTNQARMLILEDIGGSMVPFRYVTQSLSGSARHAGLARVDVRYFHDSPRGVVFRDPELLDPLSVEEAAAPFIDAGILIYSDAGAARGNIDPLRIRHTDDLLATLRRYTAAIAWLNPVPRHRWPGTTAAAIANLERGGVPMFPLDQAGLIGTINVLRGRRH